MRATVAREQQVRPENEGGRQQVDGAACCSPRLRPPSLLRTSRLFRRWKNLRFRWSALRIVPRGVSGAVDGGVSLGFCWLFGFCGGKLFGLGIGGFQCGLVSLECVFILFLSKIYSIHIDMNR